MNANTILNLAASTTFTSKQIRQLIEQFELSEKDITSMLSLSWGTGVTFDELYSLLMRIKEFE